MKSRWLKKCKRWKHKQEVGSNLIIYVLSFSSRIKRQSVNPVGLPSMQKEKEKRNSILWERERERGERNQKAATLFMTKTRTEKEEEY